MVGKGKSRPPSISAPAPGKLYLPEMGAPFSVTVTVSKRRDESDVPPLSQSFSAACICS